MPLISIPRQMIHVDLKDRVFDTTIIKQKAMFTELLHTQHAMDGVCKVKITLLVKAYADKNGEYGGELSIFGIPDRIVELHAENDTLVDASNGRILAIQGKDQSADSWGTTIESFPQATMLQGDFFMYIRENPIKISEMIYSYILQADAIGKFL